MKWYNSVSKFKGCLPNKIIGKLGKTDQKNYYRLVTWTEKVYSALRWNSSGSPSAHPMKFLRLARWTFSVNSTNLLFSIQRLLLQKLIQILKDFSFRQFSILLKLKNRLDWSNKYSLNSFGISFVLRLC